MKKLSFITLVLFITTGFAQKIDLINAPKNPVAYNYKKEHFDLKGPVYSFKNKVFSKAGLLIFDNVFGGNSFYYDANGRLTHTSEGNEFKYGSNGYIESYTYASLGIKTTQYFYNDKGLLVAEKFDKASKTNDYEYTYDSQDRVIKSYRNDNNYTTYAYEKRGDDLIIQENDVRDGLATLKTLKYTKGIQVSYDDVLMSTYNKMDAYGNWTKDYSPVIFYDDLKSNGNVFTMIYTKQNNYTIDKLMDCEFFLNGKQTDAIYRRSSKANEVIIYNPFDEKYYIIKNAVDDSRSGQVQAFTEVIISTPTYLEFIESSSYKLVHRGAEYQNNLYLRSGSLVVRTYQNNYIVYDKFADKTFFAPYDPDENFNIYGLKNVEGTNIIYIRKNKENGFIAFDRGKPVESTYTFGYDGNDGVLYNGQTPEYYLPQLKTSSVGVVHPGRKYNASTDKRAGTDYSNTATSTSSTSACITGNCTEGFGEIKTQHATLTGFFSGGKANGYGKEVYSDGTGYYQGEFVSGERHGFGMYTWNSDQSYYIGQWKEGQLHGYGYLKKGTQVLQAGYYENGKLTRNLLSQDYINQRAVGNCIGDCQNGFGYYQFSNNDKYVGFFTNGQFNHIGAYTWVSGDVFIGNIRNSEFSGQGILYYKSLMTTYYGNLSNATRQGMGVYYNKSGNIESKGYWDKGILKTSF
ncbi:hypothetical protein [Gelidibacter maritimus]|uniref:Antitoxin component YwqK of YwqJK toxin-antitoxin module n=1 Tax=Gelidibacter maritimus TaxID=2761487 RepID=A0A7W2M3L6_9FLAO|nr:hypothetical protein [Gelidibacter maritimus]MBA6152093.1 hypothetical protein [Gelidibacter maritimus]